MPNKTKEFAPSVFIGQALVSLERNHFSSFLEQMALLGDWLQKQGNFSQYKSNKEALERLVGTHQARITAARALNSRQNLAFETLYNNWRDTGLARMKDIRFVDQADAKAEANTCLIMNQPYWQIIPVNAQGEKQAPLNLKEVSDADDAEALLKQRSEGVEIDLERLKRALKRATITTLDQGNLRAKAELSKETRHRIKLGLEAFKLLCPEAPHKEKTERGRAQDVEPRLVDREPTAEMPRPDPNRHGEEKADSVPDVELRFVDREPTGEEINGFSPDTFVVLRPTLKRRGQVWLYRTDHRNRKVKDSKLKKSLSKSILVSLFKDDTQQERDTELQNALDAIFRMEDAALREKIRLQLLDYYFRRLDEDAAKAIREHKTTAKKILRFLEDALAALASFAYGTLQLTVTMLGLFIAAGIVWTNPGLAIAGVLLLAGTAIFPFMSTWTNWKVFSSYLRAFFDKIGAEYREIPTRPKKALFWGLSVLAVATGIAAGGLMYTATIAIPAMFGLGALSVIFPPLGIVLAAAVVLSQTVMLTRNFCTLLRKENSWRSFKKPFVEVGNLLNSSNASRGRRAVTWLLVGGLSLLAALGLVMSCFTSTRSVGKFFIDQFHLAPQKALAWGIGISAVASFLARIYFTLSAAFSSASLICKRLFKLEARPYPIPFKKIAAIITDSILAGSFFLWNMINLSQKKPEDLRNDIDLHLSELGTGSKAMLATSALLTTGTRYLALDLKYAGKPSDAYADTRKTAAAQRVQKTLEHYREQNRHCVFVRPEENAEAPRGDAPQLNSATLACT